MKQIEDIIRSVGDATAATDEAIRLVGKSSGTDRALMEGYMGAQATKQLRAALVELGRARALLAELATATSQAQRAVDERRQARLAAP